MKKTGLKEVVKTFSVDYVINANNILDIHRYLMRETWYIKKLDLLKQNYWIIKRNRKLKLFFCSFIVSVSKCCGSFNTIDDRYAQVCITNKMKNMNVKVFKLISGVNETRFLV